MKKIITMNENAMALEKKFVKELATLRKSNGYTQASLAKKSNMVRETIARIESGQVSAQVNTLIKILEPIGYTLSFIKIETPQDQENIESKEPVKEKEEVENSVSTNI